MSTTLAFRPRFRFYSELSVDEVATSIFNHQSKDGFKPKMRHVQDHVILTIFETQRHYWSPQMDISLEKDEDNQKTLVRCLIGPMPAVWTLFMFVYGFFGFIGFVGLTLGLSQWTLKSTMWGFWLLPVSLLGMLAMFWVSIEGKKLAEKEMHLLKHFVDDALGCDCLELAHG